MHWNLRSVLIAIIGLLAAGIALGETPEVQKRYGAWNAHVAFDQELKALDTDMLIEHGFSTGNASDLDHYFAFVNEWEQIREFPYAPLFKLDTDKIATSETVIIERKYPLSSGKLLTLVLVKTGTDLIHSECLADLAFDMVTSNSTDFLTELASQSTADQVFSKYQDCRI